MPVMKYNELERTEISGDGIKNINKTRVISEDNGWDGHCLRVFKVTAEGYTPHHSHDWEHVIHVISGEGQVEIDGEIHKLTAKDFVFVPPNVVHQFKNTGSEDFEFICIVPKRGDN